MNARIQQLAFEAFDPINAMASEGVADRHTFDQAWFQHYNQKFAELIVRECQDFVGDKGSMAVKEMLEHFGVEE